MLNRTSSYRLVWSGRENSSSNEINSFDNNCFFVTSAGANLADYTKLKWFNHG